MATALNTLAFLGTPTTPDPVLTGVAQLVARAPDRPIELVGIGQEQRSDADWQRHLRSVLESAGVSRAVTRRMITNARWIAADPTTADGLRESFAAVGTRLALVLDTAEIDPLAVVSALRDVGTPPGVRLAICKPFGTSFRQVRALNRSLQTTIPESRVHRIDPGIGTHTLLGILGIRFGSRLLEPVLSSEGVARIEIIHDESRPQSDDEPGPLRATIQTELLHLLGVLLMDAPPSLSASDVHRGILNVLRATAVTSDTQLASRRARHLGGTVEGSPVPGFTGPGDTETLAEVRLNVDSWRWSGVPITLRAGRGLAARHEIVITFADPPRVPRGMTAAKAPSTLRIGLDALSLSLTLGLSVAGRYALDTIALEPANLGPVGAPATDVIDGLLSGDTTLSLDAGAIEEAWRIFTPIESAWQRGDVPIDQYRPGGSGPSAWR